MTRLHRDFAGAVIGDPRARRALAETALDIRAERASARGAWAGLRWLLRSLAATTRVAMRIVPLELSGLIAGGWAVRLAAWTAPVCALAVWRPWTDLSHSRLPDAVEPLLITMLVLPALAIALPVAAFFASLWPAARSPRPAALQAAIVAGLTLAAIQLTPAANQRFRETVFAAYARPSVAGAAVVALPRGAAEMGIGELVRASLDEAADPVSARAARAQIVSRLGLVAVAGTFALLGAVISWRSGSDTSTRSARSRWAYAVGVPIMTVLSFVIFGNWGLWVVSLLALLIAMRLATRLQAV